MDDTQLTNALAKARQAIRWSKREVAPHEAAQLATLAGGYDGGVILEIGTALGYSAAIMAAAAPHAHIITLNPKENEFLEAQAALAMFPNVTAIQAASADYLHSTVGDPVFSMVFVDGDHDHVAMDFPWFYRLLGGGLMLFHDYNPADAGTRPCAPVYEAVNWLTKALGRLEPDVLLVDERRVGMAGFRRGRGDSWVGDIIIAEAATAEEAWRQSTRP